MDVVGSRLGEVTVTDVCCRGLSRPLAYTTVMTTLGILEGRKGVLESTKCGCACTGHGVVITRCRVISLEICATCYLRIVAVAGAESRRRRIGVEIRRAGIARSPMPHGAITDAQAARTLVSLSLQVTAIIAATASPADVPRLRKRIPML